MLKYKYLIVLVITLISSFSLKSLVMGHYLNFDPIFKLTLIEHDISQEDLGNSFEPILNSGGEVNILDNLVIASWSSIDERQVTESILIAQKIIQHKLHKSVIARSIEKNKYNLQVYFLK